MSSKCGFHFGNDRKIHAILEGHRRVKVREVAEIVGISNELQQNILETHLDIKNL